MKSATTSKTKTSKKATDSEISGDNLRSLDKKMETFWIHCNRCSLLLSDASVKNVKFYVANCTHIFCQDCMAILSQSHKCFCCPNKALRSIGALDPSLKPEIKPYFGNVLMNMKSLHQSMEYQTAQMKNLVGTYRKNITTLSNKLRYCNKFNDDEKH